MAEDIAVAPAPPEAAVPALPETPVPATPGLAKFMSDVMDEAPKTPEPPAPEKQPEVKVPADKKEPEKKAEPDKKPEAKVPADKKPDEKPEKDPVKLRERLATVERESQKKVADLEKKITELSTKKAPTEADLKKIEEASKRVTQLETELAQAAYERSPEFKQKYVEPFNARYTEAVADIKQLQISEDDGAGGERVRGATEADFLRVINAPIADQAAIAEKIFGVNARLIWDHRGELLRMKRAGDDAIRVSREGMETQTKTQREAFEKTQKDYQAAYDQSVKDLSEAYPQFFGKDDADPEAGAALDKGFEFVDTATTTGSKLSIQEQAAYAAVIRGRAAAFPKDQLVIKRLTAKLADAEAELEKFRASDPGSAGGHGGGGGAPAAPEDGGVKGLIAAFDK